MQDILEEMDPVLEPVLAKAFIKRGNQTLIAIGDKEVDYNPDFKLYITTKLSNPHYTPEVSTKAMILNFAVKVLSPLHACGQVYVGSGTDFRPAAQCELGLLLSLVQLQALTVTSVERQVQEDGLEAQLLSLVVKMERPDLDKLKNELVVNVAQGKRTQVHTPRLKFTT